MEIETRGESDTAEISEQIKEEMREKLFKMSGKDKSLASDDRSRPKRLESSLPADGCSRDLFGECING